MILKQITPPDDEPVSMEDVQGQTRIDDLSGEAGAVSLFISAVRDRAETITRRALLTQTWELVLNDFPGSMGGIILPLPPLQSVASITYVDTAGALQTLDSALYQVDSDSEPARIFSAYGTYWPETQESPACVRIRFICGYGDTSDTVPAAIRQWILMNVANLYENRETETVASGRLTMVDLSTLADSLIENHRVLRW